MQNSPTLLGATDGGCCHTDRSRRLSDGQAVHPSKQARRGPESCCNGHERPAHRRQSTPFCVCGARRAWGGAASDEKGSGRWQTWTSTSPAAWLAACPSKGLQMKTPPCPLHSIRAGLPASNHRPCLQASVVKQEVVPRDCFYFCCRCQNCQRRSPPFLSTLSICSALPCPALLCPLRPRLSQSAADQCRAVCRRLCPRS